MLQLASSEAICHKFRLLIISLLGAVAKLHQTPKNSVISRLYYSLSDIFNVTFCRFDNRGKAIFWMR